MRGVQKAQRTAGVLLVLIMVMAFCMSGVLAADMQKGVITADDVNVRSQAKKDATVIAKLPKDTSVVVSAQSGDYYRITTITGKSIAGYVAKQYVRITGLYVPNTTPASAAPAATPTPTPAPGNAGPMPAATPTPTPGNAGPMPAATPTPAAATPAPAAVTPTPGATTQVGASQTTVVNGIAAVTTAKDVRLRKEPSSKAATLLRMPKDASLVLIATSGADWYKAKYKDTIGYVASAYVKRLDGANTVIMETAASVSTYNNNAWQPPPNVRAASITAEERALWDAAPARITEYQGINKDVVAWLRIPNTNINHPVVIYKDNNKYLNTDINGKKSKYGAFYLDYKNLTSRKHLSIYGHNMHQSKTMMNNLVNYKEQSFFQANPVICFNGYGASEWELFSAYVDSYDGKKNGNITRASFSSDSDFLSFCNMLKSKSMFKTDVEIQPTDQILTLVTCSYEFTNARFFVSFRRLK